jgi:DNA-binding response OmpR family regulator
VVKGILANDYTVKAAINGEMALKIVEKSPPDIILLDIMMPGMSGYEVCEQLKADSSTRDIPVIFLTAMEQTTDEARGFELGAADYITKPVNPPILEARVRTHLALKFAMDDLQSAYAVIKKQKDRMQEELNVGRDIIRPPCDIGTSTRGWWRFLRLLLRRRRRTLPGRRRRFRKRSTRRAFYGGGENDAEDQRHR